MTWRPLNSNSGKDKIRFIANIIPNNKLQDDVKDNNTVQALEEKMGEFAL